MTHRTVLVVDDIAFVRETIKEVLARTNYQVIGEAEDGDQAYAYYSKLRPDIVTMDLVMPKVSGIEATRRILKLDKEARIVIVSAMGQEQLVMDAIQVGARDYLLKPFSSRDLIETLDRQFGDGSAEIATARGEAGGNPLEG